MSKENTCFCYILSNSFLEKYTRLHAFPPAHFVSHFPENGDFLLFLTSSDFITKFPFKVFTFTVRYLDWTHKRSLSSGMKQKAVCIWSMLCKTYLWTLKHRYQPSPGQDLTSLRSVPGHGLGQMEGLRFFSGFFLSLRRRPQNCQGLSCLPPHWFLIFVLYLYSHVFHQRFDISNLSLLIFNSILSPDFDLCAFRMILS